MKNRIRIAVRNTFQSLLWLYTPLLILSLPLYFGGKPELLFKGPEFAFIASVLFGQIIEKLNKDVASNFLRFKSLMFLCFVAALNLSVLCVVDENISDSVILSALEDQVFQACIAVCMVGNVSLFWVYFTNKNN